LRLPLIFEINGKTPQVVPWNPHSQRSPGHHVDGGSLERFRAKWMPVRVKKTRQNKRLEPGSDSIRTDKALAEILVGRSATRWLPLAGIADLNTPLHAFDVPVMAGSAGSMSVAIGVRPAPAFRWMREREVSWTGYDANYPLCGQSPTLCATTISFVGIFPMLPSWISV
jgi:hypothetical protein